MRLHSQLHVCQLPYRAYPRPVFTLPRDFRVVPKLHFLRDAPSLIIVRPLLIISSETTFPPTPTSASINVSRHDATCYLPDNPPTLAHFLSARIEPVWPENLSGFHTRCIICEQSMCDYSRKAAIQEDDEASGWERGGRWMAYGTEPHHDIYGDEDEQEAAGIYWQKSARVPPVPQPPVTGNPKLSNISTQLAMLRVSRRFALESLPQMLEYPEIEHTCCTPTGRCGIPIHVMTAGCGHHVGHARLQRWISLGKNWCRFCGISWFREEHDKTARRMIWRECTDAAVVAFDLWAGMPEDEEGWNEDSGVGKGEGTPY
jgi:hypothetical protein